MQRRLNIRRLASLSIAILLTVATEGFAQNREKFVISAKAGGINAVTGQASVHAKGESEWQQLMVTDDLDSGDRVKTASDGRVEILLNPGSYLRIGADSEVELANNSLDNLEVRLIQGTAIVEATGSDEIDLNINITTPHAKLAIVRHGLYRLNVMPGVNTTELIVRKGRVVLSDTQTKVKGGNKVIFNGVNLSVAKLTSQEKSKKNRDEMDLWSKDRGEILAKANRRITDKMVTSAFATWTGFGWNSFRNRGLWFYNPRTFCYTFLPFGYGWGSPYGGSYSTSIFFYPRSNRGYYGGFPRNGSTGSTGSTSTGSVGTRSSPGNAGTAAPRISAPSDSGRARVPLNADGGRMIRKQDN